MSVFNLILLGALIMIFIVNCFFWLLEKHKEYATLCLLSLLILWVNVLTFFQEHSVSSEHSDILITSSLIILVSVIAIVYAKLQSIFSQDGLFVRFFFIGLGINFTAYISYVIWPNDYSLWSAIFAEVMLCGLLALNIVKAKVVLSKKIILSMHLLFAVMPIMVLWLFPGISDTHLLLIFNLTFIVVLSSMFHWITSELAFKRQSKVQLLLATETQLLNERNALRNQVDAQIDAYNQLDVEMQARNFELEVTLRELQDKNKELEQINTQDALTGIRNRRYFDQRITAEFRRSRREMSPLSLVILDIDKFKLVNDTYGHLVGDQVIRQVAKLIQGQIQRVADCLCRYGGEEFVLILPNTAIDGARLFAEKLRASLASSVIATSEGDVSITVSFGVASLYVNDKSQIDELINQADKALYKAKQTGRNKVVCAENAVVHSIHQSG